MLLTNVSKNPYNCAKIPKTTRIDASERMVVKVYFVEYNMLCPSYLSSQNACWDLGGALGQYVGLYGVRGGSIDSHKRRMVWNLLQPSCVCSFLPYYYHLIGRPSPGAKKSPIPCPWTSRSKAICTYFLHQWFNRWYSVIAINYVNKEKQSKRIKWKHQD